MKKVITQKVSNQPEDHAIDPWKSAKDAVESFKQQKLYPREWNNIISEIHKLGLCATGEEAMALKWYAKAAKAASLGLPLPPQKQEPVTVSQTTATDLPKQPKITKPVTDPLAEEKWLTAVDLLKTQIPQDAYQRWFSDIVATKLESHRLFLAVPNRVYQNWIENNYRKEIKTISEQLKINIFYQTYEHYQ
ncbi:MAG: DnaA N-terminal domain-containing protein [Verrucomicrobiia bacterium]